MPERVIYKPDFNVLRSTIREADSCLNGLRQVIDRVPSSTEPLKAELNKIKNEMAAERMSEISVDKLADADKNIRISALRKAGYQTLADLAGMSELSLRRIPGIGEENASMIRQAVASFQNSLARTMSVRIDPDNMTRSTQHLVRALYTGMYVPPIADQCRELYNYYHDPVKKSISAIRAQSSIKWFFTGKSDKAQTLDAFEYLTDALDSRLRPLSGRLFQLYRQAANPDTDTAVKDFSEHAAAYYAFLEKMDAGFVATSDNSTFPEQLAAEIANQPLNTSLLKLTLRGYQDFGAKYILHQKRALLGDEMGLGKTVQALAAMCSLEADRQAAIPDDATAGSSTDSTIGSIAKGKYLVVCPASVLVNWEREIGKQSALTSVMIHGSTREEAADEWKENGGVAITNFETVDELLARLPGDFRYDMLVVDEAHYVKNPKARRTVYVKKISAMTDRVVFMTGTPLENKVDEFCELLGWLQPEIGEKARKYTFMNNVPEFRKLLAPAYLRRNRDEVLKELPELIDKEQWCTMTDEDQEAYIQALASGNFSSVRRVGWLQDNPSTSSKGKRLLEICDQAKEEKRKVLIFSFYLDTIAKVEKLLGDRCLPVIHGGISPDQRQQIVDQFTKSEDGSVLVSQIQAGGTGLNIQAASIVIFCEPQIKPSLEQQALSRAYRMGQVRNVFVHHLLCQDTVDERILSLLSGKQDIFDNYAGESVMGTENMKIEGQSLIDDIIAKEREKYLPAAVGGPN